MIRACIFDLSGTIVDKYSLIPFKALRGAFLKYRLPIRNSLIYKDMGFDKKEHIHKILFDPHISRDFMIQYGKNPGMSDTEMIFNEFHKREMELVKNINIIPETKEVIDYLRNKKIKIGVTTGFNREMAETIINNLSENGIEIDEFVSSSCLASPGRPYPHMINHLMEEFKITDPYHVMKLDDTVVGLEEGKMADVWTSGIVRWSINMRVKDVDEYDKMDSIGKDKKLKDCRKILESGKSNYIFDTLNELPEIVEGLEYKIFW